MSKRVDILRKYKRNAKEAERIQDDAARKRWAFKWRELATDAEKRRAPEYLR